MGTTASPVPRTLASSACRAIVLAAALCPGLPVGAAEQVGRTVFELPAGWERVLAYQGRLVFNGGADHIPVHHVLYQLPGKAGVPDALLMVSSTEGGYRLSVRWETERCPEPRDGYFSSDYGSMVQTRTIECLVVNPAFVPTRFFTPDGEVTKGMAAANLRFFARGASMRSVVGIQGGTQLRVNLMTRAGFAGLPEAQPKVNDLHGAPPGLVAWGEALHQAVKDSVLALDGRLQLPRLAAAR